MRHFAPAFLVPILRVLGATAVIRLDAPAYDPSAFTAAGIAHHRLPFGDQATPTPAAVLRFFAIADAAPGPIAVHCAAGRGRTGTLAAMYLMRRFGFAAREAMGWIRAMRPGPAIGEQQQYLATVEREFCEIVAAAPAGFDHSASSPAPLLHTDLGSVLTPAWSSAAAPGAPCPTDRPGSPPRATAPLQVGCRRRVGQGRSDDGLAGKRRRAGQGGAIYEGVSGTGP